MKNKSFDYSQNDASTDYLGTLEMLMAEFFSPTTQNERKKEIETMLQNFDKQQDSWKHCIYFMKKSSNQYVLMFALTTIEVNFTYHVHIAQNFTSIPGLNLQFIFRT